MAIKRKIKPVLPTQEESLVEIRKLMNIVATQTALDRIEKLDWTDKQKGIWFLCTGKMTRKQLAQKSGVHLNTVKAFVEEAMTFGLLEEEKEKGGHPKRVIDYSPSEWKSYIKKQETVKELKKTELPQAKPDEKQGLAENDEQ